MLKIVIVVLAAAIYANKRKLIEMVGGKKPPLWPFWTRKLLLQV